MNQIPIKIAVVTGSRADYGLLYCVMRAISENDQFRLITIVTGMHLSPEFGNTYKIIENDGFQIDAKVDTLLSGDSATAIGKSIGLGVIGFAQTYTDLQPDLLLVLGDRFEIFAAVQAALIAKIPVAHIAGGDVTEGAYDDAMRHGITKMAHLHFTTNSQATQRVIQLGENPEHVFTVGSPGIDLIQKTSLLSKIQLEQSLGIQLKEKLFLITFHPTTLAENDITQQCQELFNAIDNFGETCGLIFTKSNSDTHGRIINHLVEDFVTSRPNAMVVTSMGQEVYYSALAHADVVIGNSSSGLYEAPSLKTPTVNIGDRQKGRLKASSVLDCPVQAAQITNAINKALTMDCTRINNPYGDGHATEKIMDQISHFSNRNLLRSLIQKHFHIINHD